MKPRTSRLVVLVGSLAGAALFAYAVRSAGVADIVDGVRRVGWGLFLILALGGLRQLIRAECWRLCMTDAAGAARPLPLARAWGAFLAGDAIGSVTPLGLLASEPSKVFLVRHHMATREAVASLALENLVYAASVATMIAGGVAVLFASVDTPPAWRLPAIAAVAVSVVLAAAAAWLLRGTWHDDQRTRTGWQARLAHVRAAVQQFTGTHRRRLWRVFGLDLTFHTLAVLEIYLTLRWVVDDATTTFGQAVVFEALNRVVTIVFKFVPFRIGVDEALTGGLAQVLAVSASAGVTLAVVRKIRNLFWTGVGLVIAAAHPAQSATDDPAAPATGLRGNAPAPPS